MQEEERPRCSCGGMLRAKFLCFGKDGVIARSTCDVCGKIVEVSMD